MLLLSMLIVQTRLNFSSCNDGQSDSLIAGFWRRMLAFGGSSQQGLLGATLLHTTSRFLFSRYLGYEMHPFVNESIEGYGRTGTSVQEFLSEYQFPYPIVSICAHQQKRCVKIEYSTEAYFATESIFFDDSPDPKILRIRTLFDDDLQCETETSSELWLAKMIPRIHVCGGEDSTASEETLKTTRILMLTMKFLEADIHQNQEVIRSMLSDDAAAFGARGREEIVELMKAGNLAGTTYSVPFPAQVNSDAGCVSIDFIAHNPSSLCSPQRGTDIMYVDIFTQKVLRIDTLRHTLVQPQWVVDHFAKP